MLNQRSLRELLVIFTALAGTCASAEPATRPLVGGMLLDGYGGAPLNHAAILVENNRIVAVGPASEVVIPPGTPIVDTQGETMMPGMIELHAHLVLVGDGDIGRWFRWLEVHRAEYPLERVMELSARQLLSAGITSAVDLGAPLQESVSVRDRIRAGEIPGPRLSISGPWLIQKAAIFPPMCQLIVHTPAEAARAADANIRGGADVIKAQGGLTLDEYQAIVEVAHRWRCPRIEIWLAPVADLARQIQSRRQPHQIVKPLTPRSSICAALKVLTLMGTLDKGSARRVAVTTISSIVGPWSADFAALCAWTGATVIGTMLPRRGSTQ